MKPLLLLLFMLLLTAACTSKADKVVQIPTLAVLPSETSIPSQTPTPSETMTPSPIPTSTSTNTAIPTNTPTNTPTPTCTAQDWWSNAELVVEQFLDTAEVASKTSRISLSAVVLQMRQLQRQYERIDHPSCVDDVYFRLSSAMSEGTDAFANFMAQDEVMSPVNFIIATQYFWDADQMLRSFGIAGDVRMQDAALFIWGGDSPNGATATHMLVRLTESAIESATPLPQQASGGGTCGSDVTDVVAWVNNVQPIVSELKTATSASAVQSIHTQVANLRFPTCLTAARDYLLNAIDQLTDAFVDTSGNVQQYFDEAQRDLDQFTAEANRAMGKGS